jgi:carboxyl-terminal processing protease
VLLSLQKNHSHQENRFKTAVVLAACLALSACGGGGDSTPAPTTADAPGCDVTSQKDWLRAYMADQYFWTGASPNPDPAGYSTVQSYYDALLFTGDAAVPKDKWSYITPTAAYNQFFGAGKTMSYGVFVNGLEGVLPLRLRYVEPQSPAALAGLKRGDIILSANARSASELITSKDFSVLTPANVGDSLALQIDSGTGSRPGARTVTLTAASFDLTPVSTSQILTLPNGSKAGYVLLKDFISQSEAPLAAAFANFRAQGATELIIDLRYNGGGLLSTSNLLASLVAGATSSGQVFTQLNRNARNQAANTTFRLSAAPAPAFSRVVVLTGSRTCSASELLVNGLKPYMNVITVGAATCGKPFGFYPVDRCGSTFSAVNFETVNGAGQGRYYNGIAPTCAAIDDFTGELGTASEGLTAVGIDYLQTGVCSTVSVPLAATRRSALGFATLPNGRPD